MILQRIFITFAALLLSSYGVAVQAQAHPGTGSSATARPTGPCDIYQHAGNPCVAAHSTTRALYASYDGPLYQVLRKSDGKTVDISVVRPKSSQAPGGYADADAQDAFCAKTYCWISIVYDQSPKHNHLTQAPRGGFSGPALGGFNNLSLADAAPITIMGHKAYGVFIVPGMGLRNDSPKGTAVDDQAEGQYWVINGHHFNSGCCFDYGNGEIDSRDDDNGTMETTYFGDAGEWFHGSAPGPWIMTDQENNLMGCVTSNPSKLCENLPSISSRFLTAMAKGEPHHWTTLGGDAQTGPLAVIFDGHRLDATYDPMRKQGAILLGNGGDNSNDSQGTFYEGAMTAAYTFPTDATDQLIQANVVAAKYAVQRLAIAPAETRDTPPGLQTFTPGSTRATTVTFTNTTGAPVTNLRLGVRLPAAGWTATTADTKESEKHFTSSIAVNESVSATFQVAAGAAFTEGELTGTANWVNEQTNTKHLETAVEKIRSVAPVKINEFRISGSKGGSTTDTFIELYNAGADEIDLSRWTLTAHPAQQSVAAAINIPANTRLAAGGFYLFGLSPSGLAIPARSGDATIHVRSTTGMSVGDTVLIGEGPAAESRRITTLGNPASIHTTVWQPLPDGPIINIPAGATSIPVQSTEGFKVGQKIALGYGTTFPAVGTGTEKYEIATVTAIGKPGTQALLSVEARAGATNLKVTSVQDISAGDKIRLDIESVGHGIETVTVKSVGTQAHQTNLTAATSKGATSAALRRTEGIATGDHLLIGTPASLEAVTVTAIHRGSENRIDFQPALTQTHVRDEGVVSPGTGLELLAPLMFTHTANLPFSNQGTGISFTPATSFARASNEPVQALGTGLTLDKPLTASHRIHTPVRDAAVKTAGYQDTAPPDQWFGGPELSTSFLQFGSTITREAGSLILRDTAGRVVDSVNYGGVIDPWVAEGYQAASGTTHRGCYAPAPHAGLSSGRLQDGKDTDSNCNDFDAEAETTLAAPVAAGTSNLKVIDTRSFYPGETLRLGEGAEQEAAVIAEVGTSGSTVLAEPAKSGQPTVTVEGTQGFHTGQTVTLGAGSTAETLVILRTNNRGRTLTFTKPLQSAQPGNSPLAGTGITLAHPVSKPHARAAAVAGQQSTPGAPNRYSRQRDERPVESH